MIKINAIFLSKWNISCDVIKFQGKNIKQFFLYASKNCWKMHLIGFVWRKYNWNNNVESSNENKSIANVLAFQIDIASNHSSMVEIPLHFQN